jgi:2-dehydro-3-deoxyphosphogluconate aldolase/(4S)-4-hydroxy-2-oxoglutarate aldolase
MSQDQKDLAGARNKKLADLLRAGPIVPVITLERVEDAVPLAKALVAGGLRLLEITLRTPAAAESAAALIGATPDLLEAASQSEMPFIPGIATASELMAAIAHGFQTVKFFPAVAAGGIPALKALAGPFPQARFCPTGGIDEKNARDWLALSNVVAIGGSWVCQTSDIRARAWGEITAKAQRAVMSVKE